MDARSPGHTQLQWLSGLAQRWHRRRTFHAADVPGARELAERRTASGDRVSVVLPSLNESETIGGICASIREDLMVRCGLVDELIVVDCASVDGTRAVAEAAGARVYDVSELLPELPVETGKGEALWRSLAIADGDIVAWIDSDIRNFDPSFVTRLVAPLLMDPSIAFVKGYYRRPIARGDALFLDEGGRVTELLARPLLTTFFPELAGFAQPLAGEYAGRADILKRVPFFSGYSVEAGLLIDMLDEVGLDALAQVDLGQRIHRNRPLGQLSPIAQAIAGTILKRADERGRLRLPGDSWRAPFLRSTPDGLEVHELREIERPPMATIENNEAAG
jgi:glucosyl-3-phosphoglycerate synthase